MTTPNYSQHSSESESSESEWNENSNSNSNSDLSSNAKSTNGSSSSSSDSENWQYNDRNSSDSEEDVRKSKSKKVSVKRIPKRRALKIASDSEESEEHEYVRRKTASNVQYNESSEEDIEVENYSQVEVVPENESETIDKVLRKRQGKLGATGTITSIYALQDFDDPNEGVENEDNLEFQYLIKWKNRSHIHNTWETEYSLMEQNVKGLKKLENFIKKDAEAQIWRMYATPEDIEQVDCDLEMQQNLQESYFNVERIFAESCNSNGDPIYYVKWENLPYSDATWEEAPYIEKNYRNKIEHFHNRQNSQKIPSKHCQVLKYKPVFREIQEQPEYMKGVDMNLVLRDYQMQGLNWLVHSWTKNNSVILADEMGLGKTIQAISFLYYLFQTYELHGPFLCVVPLSTMTAWEREFHQWAPELNFVTYMGDTLSRDIIRQFEWFKKDTNKLKVNAILTSYEMILKDKAFLGSLNWAAVLIDEAHRLKNVESALYKALNEFNAKHKLLITGTPLQNNLRELWALLHFIMPSMFPTWENFEEEHANSAQKGYKKLHTQLEPFLLRRVKKDVEKSLPAKVEQILRVEMTARQKQYYKWILTKNFDALRKGVKGCTTTFTNIVIELKKCCNHCILTKPMEYNESSNSIDDRLRDLLHGSGKLVLLDKLLIRLKETGHRVLIFSQMVRMLNILAEYLRLRRFSFQRLDGGIKGDLRKQAMDHFNAEGSQDFCFLLSTRAGGLGINLATADTVIIFDSDWNPQNDLQAQARAHRIGQKNQVNIYRLVTAKSVEEDIIERAKQKMVLDHLVIQRMDTTGKTILDKKGSTSTGFNKEELTAILKFGAEELFKSDENKDEEPNCDIDEILRRAETRDDGPTIAGEELLSAFKVANFATFNADTETNDNIEWDDIIPIQIRRQLELEEKPKGRKSTSPLRPRNALQQKGLLNNKRKSLEVSSGDEVNESDGERPKKRGRPSKSKKEKVRNFDDAEIRRFIKSYKKFSNPSKRLDAIARDAQLQDKPMDDINRLGKMLDERCSKYLALRENNPALSNSFKLGGVSTNAKTIIDCKEELSPLDTVLPSDSNKRKKWLLNVTTKPNNFDVKWDEVEDSKLLIGIYEYGLGSWESIKLDQSLELSDKILLEDNKSPQAAHLLRRSEYLLKVLKKYCDGALKQQKGKKSSKSKSKSNEPMHITANSDPVSINALGDLAPSIFNECKEKMRPTKKALKALGTVSQFLPEKEQLDKMRLDLLQIGEQIKICLNDYRDPTEIEMWKKNLWSFVAKFSDFDSKKLQKIYKKLRKQLSKCEKRNKNESEWNENSNSNSNSDLSSNAKSTNGSSSSSSDSENWQYNDRNSSDSEEDVRKSKSKKVSVKRIPKRRALKIASDSEESEEHEYVRRKTASNVQYNESSEEDIEVENYSQVEVVPENESETIDKVLRKRQGKLGATGTITSIYALQDFDDPNEGVENEDNLEFQYLIKWKNRSHIHNTWETEYSLMEQNVKGLKKLENFIKKDAEAQIWRMYATPEDIEQVDCDLEMQQNLQESYFNVERIFAESCNSNGDPIYYVKWENLPYSDATWEEAPYIEKNYRNKIEHFHNRQNSQKIPSKHCQVLKYKPVFREIQEQPEYMKGVDMNLVLRDYQMQGLNWLVHSWTKNNSVILADEMGLGKTIQAISFLYYLFQTYELHGPFLCVVPLSTMTAWEREFHQWAPELNFVTYMGDTLSRDIIRQFEWFKKDTNKLKVNAILTSYEMILKDKAFLGSLNWAAVLIDEAHRLKNVESALYKALNEFNAKHKLLITGTPLQNNLRELWALLHFIMPSMFPTWENFEEEHANSAQKGYKKLHTQLEPFLLRRVKKDVEKSLPAKVEQILRVEMTARQKQYYKWILTKNFDALRKGVKGCTTTFTNIVIELKKCCNHCILTKPMEYNESSNSIDDRLRDLLHGSGKLVLLDKLLIRLKETGHRVLIFSQMVRMLNILAEYLRLRRFSFQRLDGGIKGDLRKQAMDHFNAEGSQDFCFLLSTRAGGLGINLATADTVIIFDSDWNPQNDLQAQARAHRIGQKNQVNIYRLVTAKSVEEDIIERAKQKMVLDHLVIQRMDTTGKTILDKKGSTSTGFNKEELTAILKFGAEELFKSDENKDEEPNCDIDEILRRAETRDDGPTIAGEELLSAFKVANFATFNADTETNDNIEWDDIIPIQIRRQLELEEKPKGRKSTSPLRPRNALQQKGLLNNKRKSLEVSSGDEVNESDGERPKKRGRPSKSKKEKVRNFDDAEIRRFIKSYKKFSNPSKRLDAIARDAQLQDKPMDDINRLGKMLDERCSKYLALRENNPALSNSFKLGGVSTNAKTIIDCKEELSPLDTVLPSDSNKRKKWLLNVTTKPNNFDVKWDEVEDSKLLIGIYEYGLGSWESIKLDQSLELSDKILLEDNKSPQAAHLLRRSEYLLKVLKKYCDGALKQQKGKKSSKSKSKSNEPMHITANSDPVSINALGDLAPSIFNECKEKMRPTKKALKALGTVSQFLPEKEQLDKMRLDLLQIGEQIKICLNDYRDPTEIEMWKKNLWSFVAKFSDFDSKKLQKIYKKLRKQLSKCEKRNKK